MESADFRSETLEQHPVWNAFTLQSLVSFAPSVIVVALFPAYFKYLGDTLQWVGAAFLLVRLGVIVGGFLAPALCAAIKPHRVAMGCELINFFCASSLFYLLGEGAAVAFLVVLLMKGIFSGTLQATRFAWLRHLPGMENSKRTLTITEVIQQASYGAVGLMLIFGFPEDQAKWFLVLDALSSLVGFGVFMGFRGLHIPPIEIEGRTGVGRLPFRTPEMRRLILADLLMACSMGGTNILLVKYGSAYFPALGGYGLTLILYALFFLLGGAALFIGSLRAFPGLLRARRHAPWFMALCFLCMWQVSSTVLSVFAFCGLFFFYGLFVTGIQARWLESAPHRQVGAIFAYRSTIVRAALASGEFIYSTFTEDAHVRLAIVVLAAMVFQLDESKANK